MKLRLLVVLSALLFISVGFAGQRVDVEPSTQPSVSTLTQHPVVGAMGIPLGTVAEITATIVSGDDRDKKGLAGTYLLRVTEVIGKPLVPSPEIEFSVPPFVDVKLASNNFKLYKMKNHKDAGTLTAAQVVELDRDYVGKKVRLAAYETGGYSGIPGNLPKDVPVWQDHGFGFTTALVVLADRSK